MIGRGIQLTARGSPTSTAVQVNCYFQWSEFPSLHHRKEGCPSDQENIAKHPRTGWFSDREYKEHHPGCVNEDAAQHYF
jgi:hypothetical protein